MTQESVVTIIPKMRRIYSDTYANLPVTNLSPEDLGWATDRLVLYRWSGAAWVAITIHSSSGIAANIPTAADLPNGSFYYETDTGITRQVQAGAWGQVSGNMVSYIAGFVRVLNAAEGNISITGVGFRPTTLVAIAEVVNSDKVCMGIAGNLAVSQGIYQKEDTNVWRDQPYLLNFYEDDAANLSRGRVFSYDADGFTLVWSKTGNPIGTATILILCFR